MIIDDASSAFISPRPYDGKPLSTRAPMLLHARAKLVADALYSCPLHLVSVMAHADALKMR